MKSSKEPLFAGMEVLFIRHSPDRRAKGADKMAAKAAEVAGSTDPFLFLFTVFVLAVFVGFYVVWSVTLVCIRR